jgi:hypothetical protein
MIAASSSSIDAARAVAWREDLVEVWPAHPPRWSEDLRDW